MHELQDGLAGAQEAGQLREPGAGRPLPREPLHVRGQPAQAHQERVRQLPEREGAEGGFGGGG